MSAIRCFARPLACTVSIAALLAAAPALAGSYTASDFATLNTAITNANGDSDPSATVTLTNNVISGGALIAPSKPITIDTGSFTYSNTFLSNTTGVVTALSLNGSGAFPTGGLLILKGTYQGATAGAGASGNGDMGLYSTGGGQVVEIDGTVAGGAGGGLGGSGGAGFAINSASTVTNKGTVSGGNAVNGTAGSGASASLGGSIVNSGTITGGNGLTGGTGVHSGSGITTPASVTNSGTIQGGTGATGAGGDGVQFTVGYNALNWPWPISRSICAIRRFPTFACAGHSISFTTARR